jgi:hypothetical protein
METVEIDNKKSLDLMITENGVVGAPEGLEAVFIAKIGDKICIIFVQEEDENWLASATSAVDLLKDTKVFIALQKEDGQFNLHPICSGSKLSGHWYIAASIGDSKLFDFFMSYTKKIDGKEDYYVMQDSRESTIPESAILLKWL